MEFEATRIGGKYEILRELGSGGFATVYLAREVATELGAERLVAIKVLRDDGTLSDARQRFSQEIRVMANLRHPHIVPLFDTGVWDGRPYLVMPYIEGESLAARIKREGKLPVDDVVKMGIQICEALDYAHKQHLVHRDVKPSNILFDATGNAWLADFGVARWTELTGDDRQTRSSAGVPGTLAYASPEQLAGDRHVDGRADLYSVGVVLFESITGELPWSGIPTRERLLLRLGGPAPSLGNHPGIVTDLSAIIARCLAVDPAHRWLSAAEARSALSVLQATGRGGSRTWLSRPLLVAVGISLIGLLAANGLGDPRLPAAASKETTRVLVTPFRRDRPRLWGDAEARLRTALDQWADLRAVDPLEEGHPRTVASSLPEVARSGAVLGASLAIVGELQDGPSSPQLDLRLVQIGPRPSVLRTLVFALDSTSPASHQFELAAEQLLLPVEAHGRGLRSVAAARALADGLRRIQAWDLPGADSLLGEALSRDPQLTSASLWSALARAWMARPTPEWSHLVTQSTKDTLRLLPLERLYLGAMWRQVAGESQQPCEGWSAAGRLRPLEFAAWFGLAFCLRGDSMVVPDHRGRPKFRADHGAAVSAYRRALELLPTSHRALSGRSFEVVRRFMLTSMTDYLEGRDAQGRAYAGVPAFSGDTLGIVAVPMADFVASRNHTLPSSHARAVAQQRRIFDDLTASWVSAFPGSSAAQLSRAIAQEARDDDAMFETISRARQLAQTPDDALAAGVVHVRLLVKHGISDPGKMRLARQVADSLLAQFGRASGVDRTPLATLAGLTGQLSEAARIVRATTTHAPQRHAQLLLLFAASGTLDSAVVYGDSTRRTAASLDSARMHEWMAGTVYRAQTLLFPQLLSSDVPTWRETGDYLLESQQHLLRGDTLRAAAALIEVHARRTAPVSEWNIDAVCPEAETLVRAGRVREAYQHLVGTMDGLRAAPPHVFAELTSAGVLLRCLRLAADLAARIGEPGVALRYRTAGAALQNTRQLSVR